MDTKKEIELVKLAKIIRDLDAKIREERSEKDGVVNQSLNEEWENLTGRIRSILFESSPIDQIRDPKTRDILRKIRDRNFFIMDKINIFLKNSDFLENYLEKHGLEVEVTDSEVDEHLLNLHNQFLNEISEKIDFYEYLERKEEFLPIITNVKLPDEIHNYFSHIRDCFLFGQMFAAVGLSRVLLEIGFKDKHQKLGLSKVINIDKTRRVNDIIREVCKTMNLGDRYKNEAKYLYFDVSSNVLHGKDPKILMNSDEVLDFIKRVFHLIEKLFQR